MTWLITVVLIFPKHSGTWSSVPLRSLQMGYGRCQKIQRTSYPVLITVRPISKECGVVFKTSGRRKVLFLFMHGYIILSA